jgi:hypothetical protein
MQPSLNFEDIKSQKNKNNLTFISDPKEWTFPAIQLQRMHSKSRWLRHQKTQGPHERTKFWKYICYEWLTQCKHNEAIYDWPIKKYLFKHEKKVNTCIHMTNPHKEPSKSNKNVGEILAMKYEYTYEG